MVDNWFCCFADDWRSSHLEGERWLTIGFAVLPTTGGLPIQDPVTVTT